MAPTVRPPVVRPGPLAALLALLLATLAVVAPTPAGAQTPAGLTWGVKQSFRSYVVGPIAHGEVTAIDGATQAAGNGVFSFPSTGPGSTYAGAVRFTGHDGTLDLTIADLRVEIDGDVGTLVAEITARASTDPSAPLETVSGDLAELDLTGIHAVGDPDGTTTYTDVPATLTERGAQAFAGFYDPGTELDPVTFVVLPEGAEPTPISDDVEDTSTSLPEAPAQLGDGPADVDRTSARAGGAVTLTGAGFQPGEQVEVWLHSTPRFLALATADAAGQVVAQVALPADAELGLHHLELRGTASGRSLFSPAIDVAAADAEAAFAPPTLPATGASTATTQALAGLGLALVAAGALCTRRATHLQTVAARCNAS